MSPSLSLLSLSLQIFFPSSDFPSCAYFHFIQCKRFFSRRGCINMSYTESIKKACFTCSCPVTEESVRPNLTLQTAVQAFLREEDLLMYKASKRRRERFEQDKGTTNHGDPRRRGVQFPFVVTDRVVIKGNKRTPPRFVGREAIVMTQCLNGWYVVKTLDNAESVKLQYRSLAKVSDSSASRPTSDKMTPNWL